MEKVKYTDGEGTSWLFTQYMLTNEVQIAYAGTEGYVPVTEKAQSSFEYQDYLSRRGEDNETYYPVKIDASLLMIENVGNTFVTPVFNGSASLRNAAGQMIENVTKSVRRREVVDESYMEKLYADMISLYRLENVEQGGPLPTASRLLIAALILTWILMAAYVIFGAIKRKKLKISD